METAATNKNQTPGTPVTSKLKTWTLYYRYGSVPVLHKNFEFSGTMLDAINRGREHCIKMGYKFICVRPFLVDLYEQEKRREEGTQE